MNTNLEIQDWKGRPGYTNRRGDVWAVVDKTTGKAIAIYSTKAQCKVLIQQQQ